MAMSSDEESSAYFKKLYYNACEEVGCHVLDQLIDIIEGHSPQHDAALNLSGNLPEYRYQKLTGDDLYALFKVLREDIFTAHLNLSYNVIEELEANMLAHALSKNNILKTLNLTMCDIQARGFIPICQALQLNGTLVKLILHGNNFGSRGGTELATALQVNNSLEYLDISNTDQDTESMIAIFTVLHSNKTLKYVDLSSPKTIKRRDGLIVHVCEVLISNTTLESLILCKHGVSDFGAGRIACALSQNSTLKHLNLSCNNISAVGASSFADLLMRNTPLEELSLCSNTIGDEGMISISEVLATHNCFLKKLWVNNNFIFGPGLSSLASSLISNRTLTHLYIWGNRLENKACNAFQQLYERGRLSEGSTDVVPYVVDGVTYLAEHGHYAFSH